MRRAEIPRIWRIFVPEQLRLCTGIRQIRGFFIPCYFYFFSGIVLRPYERPVRLHRREASPDASCRRAAAASLPKAMTGAMWALLPTDTGSQKSGIRNECNLPEANPVDDRPRRIALRAFGCSAKQTSSACPSKSNFCGSGDSAYLAYFRLLPRIGKNKLQNMESHS